MGSDVAPRKSRLQAVRGMVVAVLLAVAATLPATVPGGAVSTPTATGTFVGGRVTTADGVIVRGSPNISAADGNFTAADVGFGIAASGIPTATTIIAVTSATTATISQNATKKATNVAFAISGASAALYGWGAATMPDGTILIGDYWNFRIVHYNLDGTPATPFVFTKSRVGFGTNTNQAPFGICVDNSGGPFQGDVYMTEGSLYNVIQYDPNGNWVTSWGTTNAAHPVPFLYPSQCAVNPTNGLVYISNQWGKSLAILNPSTNAATFVSPPNPNAFIQPRGLAFDSIGNLWVADQGHHRVEIYNPNCMQNPWPPTGCSYIKTILPPGGVGTTFDMRGLAIDTTSSPNLAFVTNGQNCLVQEFNADPGPSGDYPAITKANNYGFLLNFNNVPLGSSNCGIQGQLGQNGQFEDGARGLAVDANHHVWAGDLADFRAEFFDEAGNWLNNVPTYWPNGTSPNPPALPPLGGFNGPRGAAFDPNGKIYVTDMYNQRIEVFVPGLNGGYDFSTAWGMRGDTPNRFNYPRLLCWDPLTSLSSGGTGALIVANTDSNTIVAWDPYKASGTPGVVWSAGGFASPYGVACDANTGYIYVANGTAKNVIVLKSDGTLVGSSMGTSTIGGGIITGFDRGIAIDPLDGSIWVDVMTTSKVFHFASWANGGGLLSTFTASSGGSVKCTAFGIAVTTNYLYIACPSSNNVVQYNRSGQLQGTFGGPDQHGAIGTMLTPQGLTLGPNSDLFVVEMNNNRVSEWIVPQ